MPRPITAGPSLAARVLTLASLVVLSLVAGSCGKEKDATTGPGEPPDPTATFTRVQNEVFTPSCARSGCHAGASPQLGMSLESGRAYASTVGVVSTESTQLRVAPGSPEDSYLVGKVRGDSSIVGSRMPLGGPYLSADATKLVVDWIRRGAPND